MTDSRALEDVVDHVAELLLQRIGLRPDNTLRGRLHRAIRDEAARRGEDPDAYLDSLVVDSHALQGLMNRVTVQETAFFRHPEQFDALEREVLPMVRRPVRIWSAGCANGQEAYSLAMMLEERGIEGTVVATDVSTAALRRTQAGRYSRREVGGVSPERLARHFTRSEDGWEVVGQVRDRVVTRHHNLVDPLPADVLSCQVVFCRNVLIYLSPAQVRAFLDRVADDVAPTALFVGGAETIWQASDRFSAVRVADAFLYRPRAAGQPIARPTTAEGRTRSLARRTPSAPGQPRRPRRAPDGAVRRPRPVPAAPSDDGELAALLEQVAQEAAAAGDFDEAVVAFRKCAYLRPHDPVAQLHLGLALESAGDETSARRAFAAARRALADLAPDGALDSLEGYAPAELLKLLESRT